MTKPIEPCALFARYADKRHLLYVPRDRVFPSMSFNEAEWRSVALGVELPDEGRAAAKRDGFYEARLLDPDR